MKKTQCQVITGSPAPCGDSRARLGNRLFDSDPRQRALPIWQHTVGAPKPRAARAGRAIPFLVPCRDDMNGASLSYRLTSAAGLDG